jgi:hypothetical protein
MWAKITSSMVDILLLRWFMWCKVIVVLDVWIDVYVTMFLCACVLVLIKLVC